MKNSFWLRFGSMVSIVLAVFVLGAVWSFGITTEVPIGAVKGMVVMDPSGKPLPNAEVIAYPDFETNDDIGNSWTTKTNDKGEFTFRRLPTGLYNFHAYGKVHTNQTKVVALVHEGKTETLSIKTTRSSDELDLHTNQRVFLPSEKPSFVLTGYTDETKADFNVYKVPYASVFEHRGPENLVRSLGANRNDKDPSKTAGLTSIYSEGRDLTRKDVEGHFVEQVELQQQAEGLYLVKASIGKEIKYSWISVTKIAMVTKSRAGQTLAFVTDLQTGQAIPGAKVSFMSGTQVKSAGETDTNGTLNFALDTGSEETNVVIADSGQSRAFTWFYNSNDSGQGKTVLWAQTDRPVYRPGDTVQYKIVARDSTKTGFTVPAGVVDVEVTDNDSTVVEKKQLRLSPSGTVSGSFVTDKQNLGDAYMIRMSHDGSSDSYAVSIVSYRKPEFRVIVSAQKDTYVRGESARFLVHVESYTGEPAPGMDVMGWVYQKPDWSFSPFNDGEDDDESYEGDYSGNAIEEIKGKTDENGDCIVVVPTTGKQVDETNLTDSTFTAEVDVQDASGRATSGKGKVRVVRGEFNLVAVPNRYILEPGQPLSVTLNATWNKDKTPVAGLDVEVDFGHDRWTKERSVFVMEGKQNVKLDGNGELSVNLSPTVTGEFRIKCYAKDRRGNTVGSEASIWVQTGSSDYTGPVPEIAIILDKANYQPGDMAKVLIQTSHPGGSALVTIEADSVLWSKTVALTQSMTTLDISGLSDFAPNAIVSVSYVREKEYYEATKSLKVDLVEKRINVTVEPDHKQVGPGDAVTYNIKTTDSDGKPVSANLALGIVDESIYAISEDSNDPIKYFYPRRWSQVQSAYSFPALYLDGEDKNPKAVRIRKNFQDTAYWNPEVTTSDQGIAQATITLPDNLTEWRATATAFTADTRIGKAKSQVVAKKDLMARLSLPSFFVEGDSQSVSARISNTTDRRQQVEVRIVPTHVTVEGSLGQTIELAPNQTKQVSWTAKPDKMGNATFKLTAIEKGGSANDGVEQSVPVVVHGKKDVQSWVGELTGSKNIPVAVDAGAVDAQVEIQVAPTLLGTLIQALPGLIDYPYGCTEQTVSRFVPAVLVGDLMRKTGYRDPASEARLPQITRDSLVRIKRLQASGGGWGWWEYDAADEWMTAYVLDGLYRVGQAGVDTSLINTEPTLEWAEKTLSQPDPPAGDQFDYQRANRVDLACSLLLYKKSPAALSVLERAQTYKKVTAQSLAKIVIALKRSAAAPSKLDPVYKRLISLADETRDTMHWPDDGWYEPTATALEAVVAVEPASPRVAKIFRYLLSQRRGDIWTSTRDTAKVVVSATEYLKRSKELLVDQDFVVTLNGKQIANHHFSRNDLTASPLRINVPFSGLKAGANALTVSTKGTGKIYYSVTLRQDVRMAEMAAKPAETFSLDRAFFRATPQRLEDGSIRMVVGKTPVTQVKSGEVVRCRLTITTKKTLTNAFIEVPIPSNTRIIDDEEPFDGVSWNSWWARSVFRDDRAVFFGTIPSDRPQTLEFALRAEAPGRAVALPASLSRMYQPDERAVTGSLGFEVVQK